MHFHKACAAAAATGLVSVTALAFGPAPMMTTPAYAQTAASYRSVTAATMDWGVRESFRKYIETGVAKGTISTSGGTTRSGSTFQFPFESAAISSADSGQINFTGEVHFTGHNGALDMSLRNPIVVVNGTQGELRVDYTSRKYEGMEKTGAIREGRQEVLATIALTHAPDFTAPQTTLSGTATLTASGANIFGGFYEVGEALDPISITLSLTDASGPAPTPQFSVGAAQGVSPSGTGGTGATRSNATSGPASLLGTINDTLIELNGLVVNSDNLLKNGEALYNRTNPPTGLTQAASQAQALAPQPTGGAGGTSRPTGSGTGTAPGTSTSGTTGSGAGKGVSTGTTARQTGVTRSGNGAAAGTSGSTGAGAAGGGAPGAVCTGAKSKGVTSAEAKWGVRKSFRTYIRGNIAKGSWELTGVGDDGDAFNFTGNSGAVDPDSRSGSILYPGSIRFTGHGGVLDTRFSNMEIQFNGNTGQIILNASSNSTEGKSNDFGRIAIANLQFTDLNVGDSHVSGTATASLTDVGAEAFGQFYPAGDALDPISFTAQLGGSANCVEGQAETTSAAATGKGGSANDAAKLRGGTSQAQAKLQSGGASMGGSVFDEVEGAETVASAKQPEGGKFQIKNVAGDSNTGTGGWDDEVVAKLLLLIASLVGAGGALARFAMSA